MKVIPEELADLQRVEPQHGDTFFAAATHSRQVSGRYYFPFLCTYARSHKTLLWEKYDHSMCVYYLSQRDDGYHLALFLPPYPRSDAALAHAMDRVRRFSGNGITRIIWTDSLQHPWITAAGYSTYLAATPAEYLYDAAKVRDPAGGEYERLRRMVNKARRLPGLTIRPYRADDREACRGFLSQWEVAKKARQVPIGGVTVARRCIDRVLEYGHLMRGEVLTLGDRLCGFTFGGPITATVGSLFVTISDNDLPGLAYLQRQHFVTTSPQMEWACDTTDAGREGLAHLKNAFRPVMHPLYRARHEVKTRVAEAVA